MIAKWLRQTLIWIVAMAALLFVAAGTLHWPAAWVFLATLAAIGLSGGWWLARTDPALLAERMRPLMRAEQPAADKKFIVVFGLAALIWLVAFGLDTRWRVSEVPIALQALGFAMMVGSSVFIMWVLHENSFASVVVRLQTERGHRVVSTGPYTPGCGIRCTAASFCCWSAHPCCSARGGAWRYRRCSRCCSPCAPESRNAR
jgi:protein-S-isoprenylcysteine O-methyltransferase Ste14